MAGELAPELVTSFGAATAELGLDELAKLDPPLGMCASYFEVSCRAKTRRVSRLRFDGELPGLAENRIHADAWQLLERLVDRGLRGGTVSPGVGFRGYRADGIDRTPWLR